ncbi:MAG: N-formylglutamate deformylase [Rhodobacterales bacterium]|nr:N-formylglutamate deformylase [Rhodobacterales bacterium]
MMPVEVSQGDSPIVLGLPHTGTHVPPDIWALLNDRGRELADTDWHIHRLYDRLLPGATTVRATSHRYVVDANRAPGDESLYPGQNTTGLVSDTDFDGNLIWTQAPTPGEIAIRTAEFHAPYHAALSAELDRVRALHGTVILWDCHSIRSRISFLFEGRLPDFNIGTNSGTSCDPRIAQVTCEACQRALGYTSVLNGRFKGGWTTRHYGNPAKGVHAIQMELAQSTHLKTEYAPFAYDETKATRLRPILSAILHDLAALAPSLKVPS